MWGFWKSTFNTRSAKTLLRFTVHWGNQQKGWLQLEHMQIILASVAVSAMGYLWVASIKNASGSSTHLYLVYPEGHSRDSEETVSRIMRGHLGRSTSSGLVFCSIVMPRVLVISFLRCHIPLQ